MQPWYCPVTVYVPASTTVLMSVNVTPRIAFMSRGGLENRERLSTEYRIAYDHQWWWRDLVYGKGQRTKLTEVGAGGYGIIPRSGYLDALAGLTGAPNEVAENARRGQCDRVPAGAEDSGSADGRGSVGGGTISMMMSTVVVKAGMRLSVPENVTM